MTFLTGRRSEDYLTQRFAMRTSTDPVTEAHFRACHRTVIVALVKVSYSPLGLYMFITEQEAADMYARACRRWYGDEAKSVVSSKIGVLEAKGDHKGVKAWTQVHRSLESQEQSLS